MPIKLANNASGTLATAISASDVGAVLTAGDGAEFPTLGTGDYFYATLTSIGGTQEIVKATARVGDTVTIARAQEGTTAQSFAAGSRFESRVTAQSVLDTGRYSETVSVKDYGAVGDGVTDDTAAIQTALTACVSSGAALCFPAGIYLSGRLTINSNQKLVGESKATTTIKLKNSANTDLLYGANSDALWGTNTSAGVNNVTITNLTLDGNRTNNTAGSCIAIYGASLNFYELNIANAPHHGIRTEWYQYGEQIFGMEGYFERIVIDSSGRHGWWFKGPHDSVFINCIAIDSSQETDNTWDGINVQGNANGRFVAAHVWSRANTVNIHRYGVALFTGGNEFVNSHFEGSKTANLLISASRNQFVNCLYYAAKGGLNIDLRGPDNSISGMLLNPAAGTPDCLGVRMGTSLAENVANCTIDLQAYGQAAGAIDFTYSNSNNIINIRGSSSGVPYLGTIGALDIVDIRISGTGAGDIHAGIVFDGIAAAGSTQANATALTSAPLQRISITASGTGVRLPTGQPGAQILIFNAGLNTLTIYPNTGGRINILGTNTGLSLAADKGIILFCSTAVQWNSIFSA